MKLNHINLVVANVADAVHFFTTFFDFKIIEVKGDNIVAVLSGIDKFTLVLMSLAMSKKGTMDYPDAFHIGFMLDSTEQVQELFNRLKDGGVSMEHEPRKIRDSFGFYFHFENLMIEIGHYTRPVN